MNKSSKSIDILIGKFVSGNGNPKEMEWLEKWMDESPGNRKIIQKSTKAWENSKNRIPPEVVSEDKLNVQFNVRKLSSLQLTRTRKQLLIYKVAAILAIPLTFAISWYFLSHLENFSKEPLYSSVIAPKGHISKCVLPDGTEVWVNTGSTLTYNTSSFNEKLREVNLVGEAYFEVTKNKVKPFKVVTPLANINVTGTSFNVKAYPEDEIFETVLSEGAIELEINNQSNQRVKLVPGDRAVYQENKKGISIDKVDVEMFSSWRNGEILFKDATLNDLIAELERIYDIKFHLKSPQLGEYRFRGMFSYNNNLIDALEKIKRTAEISYYIENKEVWLSKK